MNCYEIWGVWQYINLKLLVHQHKGTLKWLMQHMAKSVATLKFAFIINNIDIFKQKWSFSHSHVPWHIFWIDLHLKALAKWQWKWHLIYDLIDMHASHLQGREIKSLLLFFSLGLLHLMLRFAQYFYSIIYSSFIYPKRKKKTWIINNLSSQNNDRSFTFPKLGKCDYDAMMFIIGIDDKTWHW